MRIRQLLHFDVCPKAPYPLSDSQWRQCFFWIDRPLLGDTGMYMFDMNRRYNQPIVVPIVAPIVPLIQIKYVLSSVSYQWVI